MNGSYDPIKQKIGKVAASFVKEGMCVGLGTGSTAKYFIQALGEKCSQGMEIKAFASSKETEKLALQYGIPLCNHKIASLDLTIDGADEIDPKKNMIKGKGGALLREKILAFSSKEMIAIVDETKCVKQLGKTPLPVEVFPFCFSLTFNLLKKLLIEFEGHLTLRKDLDKNPFVTDNGNYIVDVQISDKANDLKYLDRKIKEIPGVIETGFFFDVAKRVIIGYKDGKIIIKE